MSERHEIEQWLRDHPEFNVEVPFSHASPEQDPYVQLIERSERFSLTETFKGYEEIIRICEDHIERYARQGLDYESKGLSADYPLVSVVDLMGKKAAHQLSELKKQFLLEGKLTDEVEQLERESIRRWRAILGVDHEHEDAIGGHEVGEFEENQVEIAKAGAFHRQIADLGVVHQNRITEWLEMLDLLEDDLLYHDGKKEGGVTHFAENVAHMDHRVALALLNDESAMMRERFMNHAKKHTMFDTKVIDALHETQDTEYRVRYGYESTILYPLMEAEDEASPMFDRFADYLTRSGSRSKERSVQAQGTLLNLFTQEAEWFGEAYRLGLEIREIERYEKLMARLADTPSLPPSIIEEIVIEHGFGRADHI